MNTTAQIEKRFPLKKLFYLRKIFVISFNKIYFFKDFKFLRKMQASQTSKRPNSGHCNIILAIAYLYSGQWPELDAPWPELSAQLYLRSLQFPVTRILIKVFANASKQLL